MKLDSYNRIGRQDDPDTGCRLDGLLSCVRAWLTLDAQVKRLLPSNLHPHMQAVCIEEDRLLVHAHSPMAANRLKMLLPALLPQLRQHYPSVRAVGVKMQPKTPPPPKEKNFRISDQALDCFRDSAAKVRHHPGLADALQRLADTHRNRSG